MSIPLEYMIINCQDRAKYRRKDDDKVTGFSIATSEEIPGQDAETAKVEWLVPHLSREGKKGIEKVFSYDPTIDVRFDYVKREIAEKIYLKPGESFAVPEDKKLARIIVSKLPALPESESLPHVADVDRILGFPDFRAEKPFYSPPTKD
jgi:hypothetical protein